MTDSSQYPYYWKMIDTLGWGIIGDHQSEQAK